MTRIKVGIIGCGKISQTRHIPEYLDNKDCEVVAVADSNYSRAKEISQKFNIPYSYDNWMDIVEDKKIDAVSVCTPNSTHGSICIHALLNGKHVLVEKPMATNLNEAKEMLKAAKSAQKILLVAHNQRLIPVYKRAKEIIKSNEIGKVYAFSSNFQHRGPEFWSVEGENNWFYRANQSHFGVLGDLGIHKLDLILWMLDEVVLESNLLTTNVKKKGNVEDTALISLELSNKIIGNILVSWNHYDQDHTTIIFGEGGHLLLGEGLFNIKVFNKSGIARTEEVIPKTRKDGMLSSEVIDNFMMAIKQEDSQNSSLSGDSIFPSMEALFKLYNSSRGETNG